MTLRNNVHSSPRPWSQFSAFNYPTNNAFGYRTFSQGRRQSYHINLISDVPFHLPDSEYAHEPRNFLFLLHVSSLPRKMSGGRLVADLWKICLAPVLDLSGGNSGRFTLPCTHVELGYRHMWQCHRSPLVSNMVRVGHITCNCSDLSNMLVLPSLRAICERNDGGKQADTLLLTAHI
jgi:hypothetical protein